MVSFGVRLVSAMKGKYFVLAWMPHWYPNSIIGRSKSQSYMLVVAITMSMCLMVFIRRSTIPLH